MRLPTGTVTFLFTDVEGSSKLLHELGPEAYAEALAAHRHELRAAFRMHDGVEVDTQGDSFFVAFARAGDAVAAAIASQAGLDGGPIRVRMGLHTGAPVVADGGYFGMDVHRAARIAAVAHGGQVLLSEATKQLAPETLARDLGLHRLKDLGEPLRLFQLGDETFPTLRSLDSTTLPIQATPLVGRAQELQEVLGLLDGSRLVTLTGSGGSGKTRLALAAAAEVAHAYPDGVHWVSLAGLTAASQVGPAIGRAVGTGEELEDGLEHKHALLLIDNFEHVVAAAPVIAGLLAAAPNLRVLATSREHLAVFGEQEYPVQPLVQDEAVELFVTQARRFDPSFESDEAVAAICRRLDGLPLAVELAAARVKVLAPAEILERLGAGMDLLTSTDRDRVERQRTLRATIDWSVDLLAPEERQLYARLAVFAGGWPLAAAESVCGARLDTLASLVDKSLIRRGGDGRFFMLQTLRDHAAEQLDASGEAEEIRGRHGDWCLGLAQRFKTGGVASDADVAAIEREHDNMSAALGWAFEREDPTLALELVAALWHLWDERSELLEGQRWADAAVERSADAPVTLKLAVTTAAARFARDRGQFDRAAVLHEQVRVLAVESGDDAALASILAQLARSASLQGDHATALSLAEQAVDLRRAGDDRERFGGALYNLATVLAESGDGGNSLARFREAGEILAAERSVYGTAVVQQGIGWALLVAGDCAASLTASAEGIRRVREIGDAYAVTLGITNIAYALFGLGLWADGVRLAAAADASQRDLGYAAAASGQSHADETEAAARRALGDAEYDRLTAEGSALSVEAAVERALELSAEHGASVD